jgi:DNA polymerase-3 subunit gamma/tau
MSKRKSSKSATEPSLPLSDKPAADDFPSAAPAPEGYTVLARRYRPQQFGDLIGQEPVAKALTNALESNRVAHAYLFTGARGVGKTSTARILAKALNCALGPTATPCDQCEICRSIASGEDVDVLEIDAASNRGIDEIRDLRQNVQYRPSRSRFRIYIVDEVHMLTTPAFNALLKTLEEPPAHVKFIFATTEVQKIPVTILSRCQRFDFAGIGTVRIVERLRRIVADEGMEADDEALEMVARRAGGSMRDAQSLLDQLLALGSGRLTAEQIHQLLGTAHDDRVFALAGAVLGHDVKRALELLHQSYDEGLQMGELLDQLISYWRDLLVVRAAGNEARDLGVPPRHRPILAEQANAISLDTILAGLDILDATKARLRFSSHPRVLVEMALLRLGRLDDLVSLAELAGWLDQGGSAGDLKRPAPRALTPSAAPRTTTAAALPVSEGSIASKKNAIPELAASESNGPLALSPEMLPEIWRLVLERMPPLLARELTKLGAPAIFGPNTLVLRFPVDYNSAREYIEQPANVARIEGVVQGLTGSKCKLRLESDASRPAGAKSEPSERSESVPSPYRRKQADALKEPLVRKAIERMGAQVVEVDEGFGVVAALPESPDGPDREDV